MKAKWFAIASGALETGGGIVINTIFGNLLWLGWFLVGIGLTSLILGFSWKHVIRYSKWLQSNVRKIYRVVMRMSEANHFLSLKDEQQKNPEKWLYPVVEYVDLNRQGADTAYTGVYVSYQIDSHLLYPLHEFYVTVQLCLRGETSPDGNTDNAYSFWHEVELPENHGPIARLERYSFSSVRLALDEEKKDADKKLLFDMIERFKNGQRIHAMLKISVRFSKTDRLDAHILEGNTPSFGINPINNFRLG